MVHLRNKVGLRLIFIFTAILFAFVSTFYTDRSSKASAFQNSDYSDEYGTFLSIMGESESGNDYSALSYDGSFLGRWQIGAMGLQEIGFYDSSNNWTSLAASFGITSKETFLASEAGQDYAVLAYHKKILYYAENMGVTSYIDTDVNGVTMTFSGMIAAAHAVGVGGLLSLIKNGTTGESSNDAVGLKYMQMCNGYDIEDTIRNGELSTGTLPPASTTETTETSTETSATTVSTVSSTSAASTITSETAASTATTATSTATAVNTTESTALKPPSYISVTPSEIIITVGDWLKIDLESDNASEYYIIVISQSGAVSEYKVSGNSISIKLTEEGVYTINVTGYNKAGESYAEPVYVAARKKTVVSDDKRGDVNNDGVINLSDATLTLKYYACLMAGVEMDTSATFIKDYAYVNDDNVIDISDATLILEYYACETAGLEASWTDILAS